jgi:hypothetical protein
MWNGKTAQCLFQRFMTGDTRMVLATTRVANMEQEQQLIGLRVLHHGETAVVAKRSKGDEQEPVVHDCVLRTIGFTMVQGGGPVVEAVRALEDDACDPNALDPATRTLLHRTWAWLTMDRRLVEAHTGEDLTHVYYVRIDESMRVLDVLI